MKKSKRHSTRYSVRKRHVEYLEVALECNQRIVAEQRKQISELLAKMAKAEDSAEPTVTTIRIGPASGPGFRRSCLERRIVDLKFISTTLTLEQLQFSEEFNGILRICQSRTNGESL